MTANTAALLRIPDVQARLGIKRSTVYSLVAQGELRIVKIGRAACIPACDVDAYIDRLIGDGRCAGTDGPAGDAA